MFPDLFSCNDFPAMPPVRFLNSLPNMLKNKSESSSGIGPEIVDSPVCVLKVSTSFAKTSFRKLSPVYVLIMSKTLSLSSLNNFLIIFIISSKAS